MRMARIRNSTRATSARVPYFWNSPMSDYDLRPGGSLKLKGAVVEGGIVKKYAFFARYTADTHFMSPERRRNPSARQSGMSS